MRAPTKKTTTACCSKIGIKRGPWTAEEDEILGNFVKREGEGRWRTVPKRAGLERCGKSCRLRWMNYLRPSVKRGRIAPDEEDLILRLHRLLGNRWSLIAGRIPGRTDNEIKNYWNTHLSKKLISQGIDPRTHKPLITYHTTTTTTHHDDDDDDHHHILHPHPHPHHHHHQSIPQITTTTHHHEIIGSSHHQIHEFARGVPNIPQNNMGILMEEQGHHNMHNGTLGRSYEVGDEIIDQKNTSNHDNVDNGVDLQAADTTLSSFLDSLINDDNITSSSSLPSFDLAFWESEFLNASSSEPHDDDHQHHYAPTTTYK